ncbi:hypothetical protein IV203_028964 [Nitzschia inconspicua]|uniref:Uncharacterized protein n=1 Tax=Nitzschia inconspicua TaxID=303405 RepID=A0A9K3LQX8_9STRA|nr:hypothetical protein IV203_008239 [Nitzschia inconspicua]KAG7366294.1 hypothetical protein IV203_028964 [Nitzschia inconspicua]
MGGHAAWRKRVAKGGLAKEGTGGAIARHRPRMGRRGEDIKLNKKGNIAGGNPKKKKGGSDTSQRNTAKAAVATTTTRNAPSSELPPIDWKGGKDILVKWGYVCISAWIYLRLKEYWAKRREENPFPDE